MAQRGGGDRVRSCSQWNVNRSVGNRGGNHCRGYRHRVCRIEADGCSDTSVGNHDVLDSGRLFRGGIRDSSSDEHVRCQSVGMIDPQLIRFLTRELHIVAGIERTPEQVEKWCLSNFVHPHIAILRTLASADTTLTIANMMRIPYLDKSPPSSEWF